MFAVVPAEVSVTATVAVIDDPETFANVNPISVVVVEEGTVYTETVDVPTLTACLFLNVFAICYPSAIAIATASSTAD